jgi:ribosomal protein L11 methyltransferase
VLAIAAALWGAGEVLGVDAQRDAAAQVARNAALNGLGAARVRVVVADLGDASRYAGAAPWDVVLCNVGAAEVERVLARCEALLAPGGVVIASGIFAPARARVLARAERAGLGVVEEHADEGWVTVAWRWTSGS